MRKRTLAILVGLFVLGSLAIIGCAPQDQFMPIGAKMNVANVQHDEGDRYEVAVLNQDNTISWHYIGIGAYDTEMKAVHYVQGLKQAYIVRDQDHTDDLGQGYAEYELFVPSGATIQAGQVQEGKTQVQSQMIYNSGK